METNNTIIYAKELFDGTDRLPLHFPVLIIDNEKIINILTSEKFNAENYPTLRILDSKSKKH